MTDAARLSLLIALIGCNPFPDGDGIAIAPEVPTTLDPLVAEVTGEGVDSDKFAWAWAWTRDGQAVDDLTGPEVPADRTAKGEVWAVTATPIKGEKAGPARSTEVTIANAASTATEATITPDAPRSSDTLTAAATGTDPDGDALTWTFAWTVDGSPVAAVNGPELSPTAFARGASVIVTATPNDGETDGAPIASAAVTIGNALPVVSGVALAPAEPTVTDPILCDVAAATDRDGDEVGLAYVWQVDGATVTETGATLPAGAAIRGQRVRCTVTPNDGFEDGAAVSSDEVTVVNATPVVAAVTISPTTAYTTTTLTASGSATDADGDALTWSWRWTVNGAEAGTGGTLGSDRFVKGDRVVLYGVASDGSVGSAEVASAELTILNSAPTAPEVAIDPAEPFVDDDLYCEITAPSTDADADAITYTFAWTRDGASWRGETTATVYEGDTIPASNLAVDEEWACVATASDGSATAASEASEVTILPDAIVPGVTGVAVGDGYQVRCLAWSGKMCTHIQQRVECGTCSSYTRCGEWHDTTPWNNGSNRTALNFCAIATGSSAVRTVSSGGRSTSPQSCGWSDSSHPICQAGRASYHAAGFGISSNLGLLLDPSYCGSESTLLYVECAAW